MSKISQNGYGINPYYSVTYKLIKRKYYYGTNFQSCLCLSRTHIPLSTGTMTTSTGCPVFSFRVKAVHTPKWVHSCRAPFWLLTRPVPSLSTVNSLENRLLHLFSLGLFVLFKVIRHFGTDTCMIVLITNIFSPQFPNPSSTLDNLKGNSESIFQIPSLFTNINILAFISLML